MLNEELKHNVKQTFKKDEEKDPADVLKGMSPEQIAALKEAIAQKEAAGCSARMMKRKYRTKRRECF